MTSRKPKRVPTTIHDRRGGMTIALGGIVAVVYGAWAHR